MERLRDIETAESATYRLANARVPAAFLRSIMGLDGHGVIAASWSIAAAP